MYSQLWLRDVCLITISSPKGVERKKVLPVFIF